MAYLISDYFESAAIGQHYKNRRSLAASFLSTMGSKALALTKLTNSISIKGLDYEASCAHEVIRNRFRLKFCGPAGLMVHKRARNGGLRSLQIRLKTCTKQGDYIEWQSKKMFGRRKTFCLDNLKSVRSCVNGNSSEADEISPRSPSGRCSSSSPSLRSVEFTTYDSQQKCNRTVPFISFRNTTRNLDLKFETLQDTLTCMDLIRNNYIVAISSERPTT
jgi:hypothetical protein